MAIEVIVRGQNIEGALKILRRQVSREGLFLTLRDKVAYAKPSEKVKRKRGRAESRRRKAKARWEKKATTDER